jgi:hypothetical protein
MDTTPSTPSSSLFVVLATNSHEELPKCKISHKELPKMHKMFLAYV